MELPLYAGGKHVLKRVVDVVAASLALSLVGPRPPLPVEVQGYEKFTHRRLLIKPGITGLWQVNGRSSLPWEESVRLDLHYVENWSLTGDLVILWRTFRAMRSPVGAF